MTDQGVMLIEKLIDKKLTDIFNKNLDQTKVSHHIDKLSKTDIEKIANCELDKIDTRILSQPYPLSPKTLYKFLKEEQSISIVEISDSSNLLGSCNIEDRTIGISKLVRDSPRELFILAHEYGHFVLHQKLMIGQATYESFDDSEYNFRTNKYDLKNPKHWIEWQANHFASSLVLPEALFLVIVAKCQGLLEIPLGKIHLDDQYHNIKKFNELVKRVAYLCNVTKTTVIYRLNEVGLINNGSRLKHISLIIEEYREDLYI